MFSPPASKTIASLSFRRGVGKSTVTANTAVLLAAAGYRVGVADVNFAAPSLHILFGLGKIEPAASFNDFIWGNCDMAACTLDITDHLNLQAGRLFLTAASIQPQQMSRILRGGYYVNLLGNGCEEMVHTFDLDYLLVDTQAGLGEETQLIMALADSILIVMRPDRQDVQGTGLLVKVARQLETAYIMLLINQVPRPQNGSVIQQEFAQVYACDDTAVLPHSQDMLKLASKGIFALHYPDHPLTAHLNEITRRLTTGDFQDFNALNE
jgi:septum site-determining protein MinD